MDSQPQTKPVSVRSLWTFLVFLVILFGPVLVGSIWLQMKLFVIGANAINSDFLRWLMASVFVLSCFGCWVMLLNGRRFFGNAAYGKMVALCVILGLPIELGTLIHCRGSLRTMIAENSGQSATVRGGAEAEARKASEAALLAELSAAEKPSVLIADNGKEQSELSEEIERLRAQASSMDHDGNSRNDKEIPGLLERVATKEAKLSGLALVAKDLRSEQAASVAAIRTRIDQHRANDVKEAGEVAAAGVALNTFSQFARDLHCMTTAEGWKSEEGMLNIEISFLALLMILANWLCSLGIKGVFVVFQRIEEQRGNAQPTVVTPVLTADLAEEFYDQILQNATARQQRVILAAAQNAGYMLSKPVRQFNATEMEENEAEIATNVIRPFLSAAAARKAA
jgi:hypothetical protein